MILLRPDFAFTNDTPYLTLTGELWGAFREIFKEIWQQCIESALYLLRIRFRWSVDLIFCLNFADAKKRVTRQLGLLPPGTYDRTPRTIHDDVIKWNWPFVRGIHRSPVNSPHKGQWRGALMFSLICAWINGWVNNREAGDLRRHRAHCDVTVMLYTDDAT